MQTDAIAQDFAREHPAVPLGRKAGMGTATLPSMNSRSPQDAQEIFARAEAARDQGRLNDAARLFGRSAARWGAAGKVVLATDAYFELGAILLLDGRGGLLPGLADRLLELLHHSPLPSGSRLKLQIFAFLMRKGAANPGAFFSLVQEQRRQRKARTEHDEANPGLEARVVSLRREFPVE